MRFVLAILVFSLIFSGYSAAAHAFAQMDCEPKSEIQAIDTGMDMSNCPDHAKAGDAKKDTGHATHKGKCMDCTHCCAPQAINVQDYIFKALEQSAALNPVAVPAFISEFRFSLLRPPKVLV